SVDRVLRFDGTPAAVEHRGRVAAGAEGSDRAFAQHVVLVFERSFQGRAFLEAVVSVVWVAEEGVDLVERPHSVVADALVLVRARVLPERLAGATARKGVIQAVRFVEGEEDRKSVV